MNKNLSEQNMTPLLSGKNDHRSSHPIYSLTHPPPTMPLPILPPLQRELVSQVLKSRQLKGSPRQPQAVCVPGLFSDMPPSPLGINSGTLCFSVYMTKNLQPVLDLLLGPKDRLTDLLLSLLPSHFLFLLLPLPLPFMPLPHFFSPG